MGIEQITSIRMICDKCNRPLTDENNNPLEFDDTTSACSHLVERAEEQGWLCDEFGILFLCPRCIRRVVKE